MQRLHIALAGLGVALVCVYLFGRSLWYPIYLKVVGKRTVAEVVADVGDDARGRMAEAFAAAGVAS